jgi:hypothetical protein
MNVLELGSGSLYGLGVFFGLAGARRVWCTDVEEKHRPTPEQQVELYQTLKEGLIGLNLLNGLAIDGRPLDPKLQLDQLFSKAENGIRGVDDRRLMFLAPAPAEALPLPSKSVDLCVSSYLLEHVQDPEQTARELSMINVGMIHRKAKAG